MQTVIILFLMIGLFSCFNKQKKTGETDSINGFTDSVRSFPVWDSMYVLSVKCLSLLEDSIPFTFSPNQVANFFSNGEIVTEEEAISILEKQSYIYAVQGVMSRNKEILNYNIYPSGIGFYEKTSNSITYVRNIPDIPLKMYNKVKSELNIVSYTKKKFDFALWEEWKKDYPKTTVDGSDEYKAYKKWNEKLNVNGIYKAFNLCRKVGGHSEIDYLHDVNYYCNLNGYLIKDQKLYWFYMDGGGVFNLYILNQEGEEREPDVYGCFTPKGLAYFLGYLSWPED